MSATTVEGNRSANYAQIILPKINMHMLSITEAAKQISKRDAELLSLSLAEVIN
jgi:hypothetical protein